MKNLTIARKLVILVSRVRQLRSQVSDLLSSDFKTLPYKRFNC